MKLHRIYAIILRHLYNLKKSPDRWTDAFFYPVMDIFLWGLTSVYFAKTGHLHSIVLAIVSGLIFWTLVWRGQQEISISLLEELWNQNLLNIFASPLKFSEWIVSVLVLSISKTAISFITVSILSYFLYTTNIFYYGFYLLPFIFLLLLCAWGVGLFVSGLILRFTTRIQTLAWSLVYLLSPFSCIYYSLDTLPVWAQKIALLLPTSYIFEGMREVITKGTVDLNKLYVSFALDILYLLLGLLFLRVSFNKVLEKGLVKVH